MPPRNYVIGGPKEPPPGQEKPNLPKWLFWDVRYDSMDWQWSAEYVIQRVLERGSNEEVDELVRYYGRRKILHQLKKKITYLMDHSIQRACTYFKLKPEELRCYIRKQLRPAHWL